MNSLKRGTGTRINLVLCVAMSVALGLLVAEHTAQAQTPRLVRIDGKDYPVASFAGKVQPAKTPEAVLESIKPSSETKVEAPSSETANLAFSEMPSLSLDAPRSPFSQEPSQATLRSPIAVPRATVTGTLPTQSSTQTTSTPVPVPSVPSLEGLPIVNTVDTDLAFVDLSPKSRELLDNYFAMPEVNLELIRDMFAEQVTEPVSKPRIAATLVSSSLEGLGLSEVNEQNVQSYANSASTFSQSLTAESDREKLAVETLLKSINSPQTNLMQMQSVDSPQWLGQIQFAMLRYGSHTDLALQDAIYTAIQFSPEIEVLRADVGISQAEITKQQAGFDWASFIQSNWDERNVPVSSNLDGVFARLENHTLANSLGVTKRNAIGGNVKVAQDLGFADSNSQFFNPQNQASARLALDFQQPLLQGAGLLTTRSRINIAIVNAVASQEQFIGGLQGHLLNVIQAYWDLSSARGQFVILKRSYDRALETATVVSNRVHLDVGPVQSARSEATLGARRAALLRAEYAVVLAQEKLLRLMFGQYFRENVNTEVIPTSSMVGPSRTVDMDLELQLGLQCRPEVRQSLQVIKRTSIEYIRRVVRPLHPLVVSEQLYWPPR